MKPQAVGRHRVGQSVHQGGQRGQSAGEIGKFARPAEIRFAEGLPKTRSGKIMRRLLREIVTSHEVKGDITASRKITLKRSARVVGDLNTPGIVIEEGAKLEGRIMIGSDEKPEAQDAKAPRPEPKHAAARPAAKTPPPPKERLQSPEARALIDEAAKCILCGACTTGCPSNWSDPDYLGPAEIEDLLDRRSKLVERISSLIFERGEGAVIYDLAIAQPTNL